MDTTEKQEKTEAGFAVCILEGGKVYRSLPISDFVEAQAEVDLIPGAWMEVA